MTIVNFHGLDKAEKNQAVCRLAHHYYQAGRKVLILAGTDDQAQTLDGMLWTLVQSAFIPHRIWEGDAPGLESVLIVTAEKRPPGFEVLVLGAPAAPGFLKQFPEVADFAEQYDPALLDQSRKRYKACQAAKLKVKFVQRPSGVPGVEETPSGEESGSPEAATP